MRNKFTILVFLNILGILFQQDAFTQCTPGSCGPGLRCVQVKVNTDAFTLADNTGYNVTVNGATVASGTGISPISTPGVVLWSGCLADGAIVALTLTDGFGDGIGGNPDNFFIVDSVIVSSNDFTSYGPTTFTYTVVAPPPPAVNDEPCNAIPLTVAASPCIPSTNISWVAATASAGIPAPGCASYSTGDIWFTAVVPASGNLFINTAPGTGSGAITDGGMAAYRGT